MLDQREHPGRHEPRGSHRRATAGHLGDLDYAAAVTDLHPAAGPSGADRVAATAVARVDHDLDRITHHDNAPSPSLHATNGPRIAQRCNVRRSISIPLIRRWSSVKLASSDL